MNPAVVLPFGVYGFCLAAVYLARRVQEQLMQNPGPKGTWPELFLGRDLPKIGMECWVVAAGIVFVAATDANSRLRQRPDSYLDAMVFTVIIIVFFVLSVWLWLEFEDHPGRTRHLILTRSKYWARVRWRVGIFTSCLLGGLAVAVATHLS